MRRQGRIERQAPNHALYERSWQVGGRDKSNCERVKFNDLDKGRRPAGVGGRPRGLWVGGWKRMRDARRMIGFDARLGCQSPSSWPSEGADLSRPVVCSRLHRTRLLPKGYMRETVSYLLRRAMQGRGARTGPSMVPSLIGSNAR